MHWPLVALHWPSAVGEGSVTTASRLPSTPRLFGVPFVLLELPLVLLLLIRATDVNPSVDFIAFYTAGKQVALGTSAHLYDLSSVVATQSGFAIPDDGMFPFWYPPLYAALFVP